MPEPVPSQGLGVLEDLERRQPATWEEALEAMELHLDEIRAGLMVGFLPSPYEVRSPKQALPPALAPRAARLLAAQRDLEETLRGRLASFTTALSGMANAELAPAPVFVDRRG